MVNIALSFFIIRSTATVSICSCGSIVIRNTVSATVHTAKTRISAVPIPSIPVFSEVSISTSVYPARHIPAANNMANTRFTRNTDRYPKSLYPGLSIFTFFLDLLYNGNPKMSCKWDQRQYRKEKYPNYQIVDP